MRIRRPISREENFIRREKLADDAAAGKLVLPDAIKRCRVALGLTQQQFAMRFGLTRIKVSQLETGRANPTQETLMKIAAPFGLTLGFLPRRRDTLTDKTTIGAD